MNKFLSKDWIDHFNGLRLNLRVETVQYNSSPRMTERTKLHEFRS